MKLSPLVLLLLAFQDPSPAPVTFTKDVAPILFANCAGCHRPGEVAPFPLLEYGDVKKRAKQIQSSVESRQMPPWKPVEGWGEFHGERRLKTAEIATIKTWVDRGCAEGDAKDLPPVPVFNDGWAFGEPDLVLRMPEAYTVPAEGKDIFRAFTLPLNLSEMKYVRAVQYRPSNKRVVHHALMFVDISGESRRKDAADPEPGFEGLSLGLGSISGGSLGVWTPGSFLHPFPEGMGKELRKNSDFVMQVHFNTTGKVEKEQSEIGFWFAKEKPAKLVMMMPFAPWDLDLPPCEKDIKVSASVVLPMDVELYGIIPHAHFLGRECRVWAKSPEGKETPLIWIKDWDYNLQEQYRFRKSVQLTKGTEVTLCWTYDNTASNPRNLFNPPRRVRWGDGTMDEMAMVFMDMATVKEVDRLLLYMAFLSTRKKK
jgi:hypothetical protein